MNEDAKQARVSPESEWFHPPPALAEQAHIPNPAAIYARAAADRLAFWEERAETLEWYRRWDHVLDDSDAPFYRWFTGAQTNITLNALDRHLNTARRNQVAFIWEGEPGDQQTYSYWQLSREVNRFANVLRGLGLKKGRPRNHLHGAYPGNRHRHARLRQNRRAA